MDFSNGLSSVFRFLKRGLEGLGIFARDLLYENNEASLTRFLSLMGYMLFAFVTIYLIVTGKDWEHYLTFASYTGGGGAIMQLANKAINSKWNTPNGSYEQTTPNRYLGEPQFAKQVVDASATKEQTVVNSTLKAKSVKED